jgi:GNAT superfamily N-acetyltransferase
MIKLKHLIPEYVKGEPLEFTHDCRDNYKGQNYCTLIAYDKRGIKVGKIDYSTYENVIYIDGMETVESERRKGIATAMIRDLHREHPRWKIVWGITTPEGAAFIKTLRQP